MAIMIANIVIRIEPVIRGIMPKLSSISDVGYHPVPNSDPKPGSLAKGRASLKRKKKISITMRIDVVDAPRRVNLIAFSFHMFSFPGNQAGNRLFYKGGFVCWLVIISLRLSIREVALIA
jgi:hypothetical protein